MYDLQTWENEGGFSPETAKENVRLKKHYTSQHGCEMSLPLISKKRFEYLFTCLISSAIDHVNKYKEKQINPTPSQIIGEFATVIRRLKQNSPLAEVPSIDRVEFWQSVGVPASKTYFLPLTVHTSDGTQKFTLSQIQYLCEMTGKMTNKTVDEEFKDISSDLDNLLRQTTGLDLIISKAKDLNSQATECMTRLCWIADGLLEK